MPIDLTKIGVELEYAEMPTDGQDGWNRCGDTEKALKADLALTHHADGTMQCVYVKQRKLHADTKAELIGRMHVHGSSVDYRLAVKLRDCSDGRSFVRSEAKGNFGVAHMHDYERMTGEMHAAEMLLQRRLLLTCQAVSSADLLRGLRRPLPVTKSKIDWDKLVLTALQP